MEQRGRKSTEGMVVIAPEHRRPSSPSCLTTEQSTEWDAIVGRMPADWFTRETHALLVAYLEHWSEARNLSVILRNFNGDITEQEGIRQYDKLLLMRDRETKGMVSIARAMRMTQQAKYNAITASSQAKQGSEKKKPWAK